MSGVCGCCSSWTSACVCGKARSFAAYPVVLKSTARTGERRQFQYRHRSIASPASRAGCAVPSDAVAAGVEARNGAADAKAHKIAPLFVGAAALWDRVRDPLRNPAQSLRRTATRGSTGSQSRGTPVGALLGARSDFGGEGRRTHRRTQNGLYDRHRSCTSAIPSRPHGDLNAPVRRARKTTSLAALADG
jgi:hypothetical protein